jgi:hypothetical protein
MVMELDWVKKGLNSMLVGADWLNIVVGRGVNKVTSLKLTKYDFKATHLDTSRDANMNNSCGERI